MITGAQVLSLEDKCGSKSSNGGSHQTSGYVNSSFGFGIINWMWKAGYRLFLLEYLFNNLIIYST